jgi:ethanolaminephosphotransferase
MFNLVPHLLMIILFGKDMEGELPSWFCWCLGVCFFLYMVCDNVDGKQARRTASSSPLGMLFDHGIDCCTAVINNLIMQRMMQVGKRNMHVNKYRQ